MDLEQAYRVLELKPGAGIKEAVEARDDQLVLWDPERLAHHPRLRSRARSRIETIREAYEVVMRRLGESGRGPNEAPGRLDDAAVAAAAPVSFSGASGKSGASSLFDEVFSSKAPTRRSPVVGILLAVVALLVLALAFLLVGDDKPATPSEPSPATPSSEGSAEEAEQGSRLPSEPDGPPALASGAGSGGQTAPRVESNPPPRLPPRRLDAPKLVRRTEGAAESPGGRPGGPSDRPKREGEWIYRRLLSASTAARRLAEDGFAQWRFRGWEIVQTNPPEYWVDLYALDEAGATAHFIWSVNLRDGQAAPWNEAARSLESSR